MATISQLREGLVIHEKYGGSNDCAAEHDIIYAGSTPADKMSKEDVKRLEELHWYWHDDYGCWAKFT